MLTCLVSMGGVSHAEEQAVSSPNEAIVIVLSRSNIAERTEGRNLDDPLVIYARLKHSMVENLKAHGLKVVTSDDDQKTQDTRYVLTYTLEKVKFGFRHPFGRPTKINVKYVFENKSGETVAAGQIDAKSKTSWKKCVKQVSSEIAGTIADALEGKPAVTATPGEEPQPRADRKAVKLPADSGGNTRASQKTQAMSLGVSGFMTDAYDNYGYAAYLSHEMSLTRVMAIYAKIGYIDYQCDDKFYSEAARGFGGEIGARFYPGKQRLQGWYMGLGVGLWDVEGTWKDDLGTPFVTTGKGKTTLTAVNIHTGYKIPFESRNFYLDPSLQIEGYERDGAPGQFGQLGTVVGVAVAAGITW